MAIGVARSMGRLRIGLLAKILVATLLAAFFPLLLLGYSALQGAREASDRATGVAVQGLDQQALNGLQIQAVQVAGQIGRVIDDAAQEALSATSIPRTPAAYLGFYQAHQGTLWLPTGGRPGAQEGQRRALPLYREMAYIDARGQERIVIRDGRLLPPAALRNVANPAQTTYGTETYFADTRALAPGDVYVSHLIAWYPQHAEQDTSQPDGAWYASYSGVIRFGVALRDGHGTFEGLVLLSLDARQMMEPAMHIVPGSATGQTAWPAYSSGNYAFVWDDEGWLIAHPLISRLRGLDPQGHIPPPFQRSMTAAEKAQHPFNMALSSFSPDAPVMYAASLRGSVGYRISYNDKGLPKADVYAPIPFSRGLYRRHGVFGGVVIGIGLAGYHEAAIAAHNAISDQAQRLQYTMRWIALGAFAFLGLMAGLVALSITRPLRRLTEAARAMGRGTLDMATLDAVASQPFGDEVTELARVFRQMAEQVNLREIHLQQQVAELVIQIDRQKEEKQVAEIVATDYFQYLTANAAAMRGRFKAADGAATASGEPGARPAPR